MSEPSTPITLEYDRGPSQKRTASLVYYGVFHAGTLGGSLPFTILTALIINRWWPQGAYDAFDMVCNYLAVVILLPVVTMTTLLPVIWLREKRDRMVRHAGLWRWFLWGTVYAACPVRVLFEMAHQFNDWRTYLGLAWLFVFPVVAGWQLVYPCALREDAPGESSKLCP